MEPQLQRSAVFSAIDRVVVGLYHAGESSTILGRLRPLALSWSSAAPARRRMAGGVILLSAVAAHLGLMALNAAPPGWFWVILPGIALAIGAILVMSAGDRRG
jgi:hypothetical protein